jgi:predicted AAA+ superfamily ATPase
LTKETVADYIETLERMMIIEDLPAWNTHIRSKAKLRSIPKRHSVGPSIAVGALGLTVDNLMNDLECLGYLFESMVLRDIRVYAEKNGGKLFHYRDSYGLECDMVIEYPNNEWVPIEVKLGNSIEIENYAAENLRLINNNIDKKKVKEAKSLIVITGSGFAYKRKDGVNVIPINALMP